MQTPTSGATASATQTEEAVFTANRTTRRTNKPKPERQPLFKPAQTLSELFATARETAFNQSQYLGDLFNADDFTVFFGTSNSGKSILAYQLAEAIATGKNFFDVCSIGNREKDGYKLNNLNPEQVVLIADFETSENKLTRRYSNEAREQYEFSDNIRLLLPQARAINDKLQFIVDIEKEVIKTGAKVVIIDNMSAISYKSEDSTEAAKLMNCIKDLQTRQKVSIIVIAHTPKGKEFKQLEMGDLAGSANYFNLSDTIFAIAKVKKYDNLRYLKQLKCRTNEFLFGENNCITMELKSHPNGFLGYDFSGYNAEETLLERIDKLERQNEYDAVLSIWQTNKDMPDDLQMNNTQIANQLYDKYGKGIDRDSYRKSISRLIKRIVEEQQTETPSEPQPQQRKTPVKSLPKEQPQQQSNLKQTTVVTTEILKAIGIQQQEPEFSEAELRADIEQLRKNNSNNTNDHNYDDLKF